MSRTACARVDLAALRHNLRQVKQFATDSRVLAVIKANGYGHGIVQVAQALSEADSFGVACLEEAVILREAGINKPILLLEGCFSANELAAAAHYQLDIVVHHQPQLEWLEAWQGTPFKVWLKVDTGMHRLGFLPAEAAGVIERLNACHAVTQPMVLMSHLANADDPQHPQNAQQLAQFSQLIEGYSTLCSFANSAALLALPETHHDWVRPGIMLYGVSPFVEGITPPAALMPVMTFSSQLFAIRHCQAGDAIGYGSDWVCPDKMPVGVVAVGYGDGYPRHAPSGTPVLINGIEVPLIGRVSMDMICVDLRGCPQATLGDEVILWGRGLPVERIASAAGTIAYELLCGVTGRVTFEYLD
jgi:alanine racemase